MIISIDKEKFYDDFLPIIIDLECGSKYDKNNPQHVEYLKKKIDISYNNYGIVLAEYDENGEAIGYIWYEHDTGFEGVCFSGKKAHIRQIGVYDEYQRKGVGKRLLNEAALKIKQAGGEVLYTDTYADDNGDAMAFYVKTGFIPVALLPGMNGLDDFGQVYMYKILK